MRYPPDYYSCCRQMRELEKIVLDPNATNPNKTGAAKSWAVLNERKRIMRMQPSPKAIEVHYVRGKGATSSKLADPVPE